MRDELELRAWAFRRTELRTSSRIREEREVTCGHQIDRGEPYLYFVGKANGLEELVQTRLCDVCQR